MLNKVVNFGYNPMIKKTKKGARGYGAKKRDKYLIKKFIRGEVFVKVPSEL